MLDLKKITAANLRRIRTESGMTQEQLAALMHIKKQYVSALETGRRGLSDATIPVLCEIFACSPADFFEVDADRHADSIDRMLAEEVRKMDKRKKAALYAHAVALNSANGSMMSRRAGDARAVH